MPIFSSVSPDAVKVARERSKKIILEFAEKYGWHNAWNLDEAVKYAIIMIKNALFIYLILRCEYIIL